MKTSVVLRRRQCRYREGLLVCLNIDGKIGWGEIAPLPGFSQETLVTAARHVRQWIFKWQQQKEDSLGGLVPSAAFGISCALAELHDELGEQGSYQIAPIYEGSLDEFYDKMARLPSASEKVAKMKVGLKSSSQEGVIVNRCLDGMPELKLRLDANRMWSFEAAMQFIRKISPENRERIQFIEEPCQTPVLSRRFARRTHVAIAWDETVRDKHFLVKKEPYVSAIVIKPTLVGSIQKCVQIIEQAHQCGLQAVISSSIESSLGLTQLARLAHQYTPNTIPGLDTLQLFQCQLLRPWQYSTLPLVDVESASVIELDG